MAKMKNKTVTKAKAKPKAPAQPKTKVVEKTTVETPVTLAHLWTLYVANITLKGRLGREDYFRQAILYPLLVAVACGLGALPFVVTDSEILLGLYVITVIPLMLGMQLLSLCATVRRMHDLGISGWWYLLVFAVSLIFGLLAIVFVILLLAVPGQEKKNAYGPVVGKK